MNILIIEDSLCMAKPMRDFLQRQGHKVTWVVAVTSFEPFVGRTREGEDITLSGFDLVIQDGQLAGTPYQGVDIVRALAKKLEGTTFLGASTINKMNQEMVEAGAAMAATKPALLLAFFMGEFDLSSVLKAPRAAEAFLSHLQATMLKDEKFNEPRRLLDLYLQPFLKEEFGS